MRLVAAIVYHHVNSGDCRHELFPEVGVCLVANEHADAFPFVGGAGGLDVNPVDLAAGTEV